MNYSDNIFWGHFSVVIYFLPITSLTLAHISYFKLFFFFSAPASFSAAPLFSGIYLLFFFPHNFFFSACILAVTQVLEVKRR